MKESLKRLLYRSFDEELSADEQNQLKDALGEYPELHEEQERLRKIRVTLSKSSQKSFGPFFVDRVMANVDSIVRTSLNPDNYFEWLFKWFRPVAAVSVTMLLGFVIVNLASAESLSLASALGIESSGVDEVWLTPLEQMIGGN